MFVTFHSNAYEDISYFGDVAKRLLALMGHSGAIPGAIKAGDLSAALNQLQSGLSNEKSTNKADDENEEEISLARRAVPLIALLQAAIEKDEDVLWD